VVAIPPRLIDTTGIADLAKRLDEVNGLRTNLLGVLAGLAVIAGTVVGVLNFRETSRQNRAIQEQSRRVLEETQRQNQAVLDLQRRGQVTERFTRAIEQLGQRGDDRLDVRIGAVYAQEQIARDSAELHWPIMEVLTAYLRGHTWVSATGDVPAGDPPALGVSGRSAGDRHRGWPAAA
jgi:ABC-type multidrug transport system fused ATPase/permease subunit